MKPIPKAGIVFKSSLVLSGKAAKDNFTTEPRSPSRLLGRIELICNRSRRTRRSGFASVVVKQLTTFGVVRQHQRIWIKRLEHFA
ncbi:hypothetical protein ACFQHW_05995 [Lapidilactobacillus achengensis]|uniref:Uncharacterized protein n=1 Tax=Lapidilactobacillus achengensis TaxID=2486000 RepID=A0ABW1UN77_9LACO|nr:hypothetical protein [Lapidilactobacillus achengensis]